LYYSRRTHGDNTVQNDIAIKTHAFVPCGHVCRVQKRKKEMLKISTVKYLPGKRLPL